MSVLLLAQCAACVRGDARNSMCGVSNACAVCLQQQLGTLHLYFFQSFSDVSKCLYSDSCLANNTMRVDIAGTAKQIMRKSITLSIKTRNAFGSCLASANTSETPPGELKNCDKNPRPHGTRRLK